MGFRVSRLDAGGAVEAHVHSFEESIYVMEGSLVLDTVEGSHRDGGGRLRARPRRA